MRLRNYLRVIAVLLGAIQAASNWSTISSTDTISYLDIADQYWQGNLNRALNGAWSPFYSWMLGLGMNVVHPSGYSEYGVIRIVNFVIYLLALNRFEFLLNNFLKAYRKKLSPGSYRIPDWIWQITGFALFLWASLRWIGVHIGTPDLGVSMIVYWAAGILLRIESTHHRDSAGGTPAPRQWILLLGIVLGIGYLWKTVLFFVAFFCILALALLLHTWKDRFKAALLCSVGFLLIAGPFIYLLSAKMGRLTVGDSGKLAYALLVLQSGIPDLHWQGGPEEAGTPLHPTRKVHQAPDVFEFATPIAGTYPPWYDPTYWNEGIRLGFNPQKQIRALVSNVSYYWKVFLGPFLAGLFVLLFASRVNDIRTWWKRSRSSVLLIPAVGGLLLYALATNLQIGSSEAQPYTRLIAPFVVLAFFGCFRMIDLPDASSSHTIVLAFALTTVVLVSIPLLYRSAAELSQVKIQPDHPHWEVAREAKNSGLKSGDAIGIIGKDYDHAQWARLLKVRIVSQLPEQTPFWLSPAEKQESAIRSFQAAGVRAIVRSPSRVVSKTPSPWRNLGQTGYQIWDRRL